MGRRADSATIKSARRKRRQARKNLREQQREAGLTPVVKPTVANHLSQYKSPEEEQQCREQTLVEKVAILRALLPTLLGRFAKIPDPRQPKKIKHKLTVLMLYGILSFVLQMASRREANREMSRPMFKENLMLLFPDLETIAHHDTLMRLLICRSLNAVVDFSLITSRIFFMLVLVRAIASPSMPHLSKDDATEIFEGFICFWMV